jgi:hypothetical protein
LEQRLQQAETIIEFQKKWSWAAERPTLHHENGLPSEGAARSETAKRFGIASPKKNCRGSFRYPALLPSSTSSKVVIRTLLRAPAQLRVEVAPWSG